MSNLFFYRRSKKQQFIENYFINIYSNFSVKISRENSIELLYFFLYKENDENIIISSKVVP